MKSARYSCQMVIKFEFLDGFFDAQMPNFKKIRSMGADLLRAEVQADMTKLLAAFHSFSNAPSKIIIIIKLR